MGKVLFLVGQFLLSGLIRNVLVGAGLGLATGVASKKMLDSYIAKAVNSSAGLDSTVLALLHLSGFDVALSIIISALVTKMFLNSVKVSVVKK